MNYQEKIEAITKDRDQALQNIANLNVFVQQCNGKLIILNDLKIEAEKATTIEAEKATTIETPPTQS
jgi:hypothetical protein